MKYHPQIRPHQPGKPIRLCTVCGARVININPKCKTCSPACTIADEYGISRERAMRLLPEVWDFPIDPFPPRE